MTNTTAVIHDNLTPRQKAVHLTVLFAAGQQYTAGQVADMFGMTVCGAHKVLSRISGAIPIVSDEPELRRDSNGRFSPVASRWRSFDYE